jgi:twitching motility protein PilJ
VLREISAQTADSTHATAQAIIKMADLAGELRKSIAGFRLPAAASQSASAALRPAPTAPAAAPPSDATATSQARLKKLGAV